MSIRRFRIWIVLAALAAGTGCGRNDSPPGTPTRPEANGARPILIGFSMGGIRMERWQKDEQIIVQRAQERGARIISLSANENPDLQNDQAENLLIQGVDVLLVVPHSAEQSAVIVERAHEAGIPVVAYDRIIRNCPLDYYVSFNSEKVGEYQARGVLDHLDLSRTNRLAYIGGSPVDNNSHLLKQGALNVLGPGLADGSLVLALDTFTTDWSAQNAYLDMQRFLEGGGNVDGVIAANDATASGVIQALHEFGRTNLPVSGQDAERSACRRILAGTQTLTVYKPLRRLGHAAVDVAIRAARGQPVQTNAAVHNGYHDVPSILLESIPVTRDNLAETVIRDGFHSHEAVFGPPPPPP